MTDDINHKENAWQESQRLLKYVEEDLVNTSNQSRVTFLFAINSILRID